jgi:hypothetical protein
MSPLNYILGMAYARRREKRGIQGEARKNRKLCGEKNWIENVKGWPERLT